MMDQMSLHNCPNEPPKLRTALGYPPTINDLFMPLS